MLADPAERLCTDCIFNPLSIALWPKSGGRQSLEKPDEFPEFGRLFRGGASRPGGFRLQGRRFEVPDARLLLLT
jgi:hypothetical protein